MSAGRAAHRLALRLYALVLAPGVVAHEGAHWLACKLTGTRVREVCWFRLGDPAGYVVHDQARGVIAAAAIALAPLTVNAVFGALLGFRPGLKLLSGEDWTAGDWALAWLGLVVAARAAPSAQDAKAMMAAARAARFGILKAMTVAPVWALLHLWALPSRYGGDLFFGAAICMAAPAFLRWREGAAWAM